MGDNGKPVARRGRKAMTPFAGSVRLPNKMAQRGGSSPMPALSAAAASVLAIAVFIVSGALPAAASSYETGGQPRAIQF